MPVDLFSTGILLIPIKVLCYGGGALDLHSTGICFLVFTRKHMEGVKIDWFLTETYRIQVLIPYIEAMKKVWDHWEEGEPVTNDLTAASWFGGDTAQLQTIIKEHGLGL